MTRRHQTSSPSGRTAPGRRGRLLRGALALGLVLGCAGCESLDSFNPFGDNKKPLPGTRQQVFPEGVPGVDYSARPSQPSNANAPIDALPAQRPAGGQQNN